MRRGIGTWVAWGIVVLLSLAIAAYALVQSFGVAGAPGEVGPAGYRLHPWLGVAHGGAGAIALGIGSFQFLPTVQRRLRLHRTLGWTFVLAVLVSGISGGRLALDSGGGVPTALGFGGLAVTWIVTLACAMRAIRGRRIQAHREWMIRCFALAFAAVALRIQMPLFLFGLGLDDGLSYRLVSFACWIPNLVAAEWWIRRSRR